MSPSVIARHNLQSNKSTPLLIPNRNSDPSSRRQYCMINPYDIKLTPINSPAKLAKERPILKGFLIS